MTSSSMNRSPKLSKRSTSKRLQIHKFLSAPRNGVEFHQGSIGTIRSSLAMLYYAWRRQQFLTNQRPRNYLRQTDRQKINILSGPALNKIKTQKSGNSIYYFRVFVFLLYLRNMWSDALLFSPCSTMSSGPAITPFSA